MNNNDQVKLVTTVGGVVAGCILAWMLLVDRQASKPNARPVAQQTTGELKIKKQSPPHVAAPAEVVVRRPLLPPVAIIPPKPNVAPRPAEMVKPQVVQEPDIFPDEEIELPPPQPAIPLEVARFALGFVGADPQANEVWNEAINDPNLSPKARQDLIEDLNEEGFADPRNITQDDLPLILSRIALIEEIGPDAMDEVNAQAFAEAYKDLVNMALRLQPPPDEFVPN